MLNVICENCQVEFTRKRKAINRTLCPKCIAAERKARAKPKVIRNADVVTALLNGKKPVNIAGDLHISRQRVSKILIGAGMSDYIPANGSLDGSIDPNRRKDEAGIVLTAIREYKKAYVAAPSLGDLADLTAIPKYQVRNRVAWLANHMGLVTSDKIKGIGLVGESYLAPNQADALQVLLAAARQSSDPAVKKAAEAYEAA